MSSQPESELIHIIFTIEDIESIAEDAEVDFDLAIERVRNWVSDIEEAAIGLIYDQLYNAVERNAP
jgi:hypothetical protein